MAGYIGSKSSVTLVDGYSEAEADAEFVNDPNSVITVSGAVVTESANSATVEHTINNETSSGNRYSMFTFKDQGATKYYQYQNHNDGNILFRNEHATGSLQFMTNGANERMRIDASGNIGIGTSPSAAYKMQVAVATNNPSTGSPAASSIANISGGTTTVGDGVSLQLTNVSGVKETGWRMSAVTASGNNGDLVFNGYAGGADYPERMRIDSSGNLLVGKTTDAFGTAGVVMRQIGIINITRANGGSLNLNRTGSDGALVEFHKESTTVGNIGTADGNLLYISSNGNGVKIAAPSSGVDAFGPSTTSGGNRDNTMDIGWSSNRFDDIYATNGTIQTSDATEKQDIASLTATEMLVGKRLSGLFKTFRWKDSVAEKGDNARTHTGTIAQDVQSAFTAEGLDAGDYSLFISTTWWETQTEVPEVEAVAEVTDEDGNVTTEAVEAVDAYTRTDTYETEDEAPEGSTSKTRMGIRYPELLSFVAAYNEQRFASIEARLTALEDV